MISTCGIYSVVSNGYLNAPFVALNDEHAMKICAEAFKGTDFKVSRDNLDLRRIGTLHFENGIIDTESYEILWFGSSEFVQMLDNLDLDNLDKEDVDDDEISSSV